MSFHDPRAIDDLLCEISAAHWARSRLGISLHPWQGRFVDDPHRNIVAATSRQIGKSMSVGIKSAHRAIYWPESTIVITSPSERQSTQVFKYARTFLRKVGQRAARGDDLKTRVTLASTGSQIISLPGSPDSIRGVPSADLVFVDECAFAPVELVEAVSPMLAVKDGQLVLTSTPKGKQGPFYEAHKEAKALPGSWSPYVVPITDTPPGFIKPGFIERERRRMGERKYSQEYMVEFLAGANSFIDAELVADLFEDVADTPEEIIAFFAEG